MKKFISVILAIGMVMCVAGCQKCEKPNYSIETELYCEDEISIKYPQVRDLDDDMKEKEINNLIKDDLIKVGIHREGWQHRGKLVLSLDYEIKMQTDKILSILYIGDSYFYTGFPIREDDYRHTSQAYAININLENVTKLELSDFTNIDMELVKKVKNAKYATNRAVIGGIRTGEDLQEEVRSDWDDCLLSEFKSDYYHMFCVTPDSLILGVSISLAGGHYALVEIPR